MRTSWWPSQAGSSPGQEAEPRALDLQDIRYGLSQLAWREVLPEMGGEVVSKVVWALLTAQDALTTAELAEVAGCSQRAIGSAANQRVFAELEAAGVLSRTDRGEGKGTYWRLQVPFRVERQDGEPVPPFLVGESSMGGVSWQVSDAVFETLVSAAESFGVSYELDFGGSIALGAFTGPVATRDLSRLIDVYPGFEPVVRLLATLLDQEGQLSGTGVGGSLSLGTAPDRGQITIETAVSGASS